MGLLLLFANIAYIHIPQHPPTINIYDLLPCVFPPTSVPFLVDIRTCHRVNDTPTTSDQKQPIGGPNVPSRFFLRNTPACLHPSLLSYVLYLDTEMPTHFKKYKILFPLSLYLSNQFTQNPTVFDGRDV